MKKIFFFASAMLVAASMSAETVFDWANNVGKLELNGTAKLETVKSQTNTVETNCIAFNNGYVAPTEGVDTAANYAQLTLESAGFLAGDVIVIDYFFNNSDETKVATVGIYNTNHEELAVSPNAINGRTQNGFSTFQYTLEADMDTIRLARAKSGKTKTCVAKLEVIRGGVVIAKAGTPIFSVAAGDYYDPFKLALSATPADSIFVRLNNGTFAKYTDSIAIDQYDVDYVVEAYAVLDGAENSDTVSATYKLTHFVPRPVFNARKTIRLDSISADDIQILSGDNATKSTYTMDGVACPSVNYLHVTNLEGKDSVMIIGFKDRDGLTLRYKNSSDKANALKLPAAYAQCDSKNFEFYVDDVKGGDTIVFVVTAKGSAPKFDHTYSTACYLDPYQPEDDTDPCFTDGEVYTKSDADIKDDYIGWTNLVYIVQEGHTKVRLKEVANGCRIAKIQIGAYRGEAPAEGLVDTKISEKAVKRIIDGQLIIMKGDRKFNVLGTEIK